MPDISSLRNKCRTPYPPSSGSCVLTWSSKVYDNLWGVRFPRKGGGRCKAVHAQSPLLRWADGCSACFFCSRERDRLTAPLSALSGAASAPLLGRLPPVTEQGLRTSSTPPPSRPSRGQPLVRARLTSPSLSEWHRGLSLLLMLLSSCQTALHYEGCLLPSLSPLPPILNGHFLQ